MSRRRPHVCVVPLVLAVTFASAGTASAQADNEAPLFPSLLTPRIDGDAQRPPGFQRPAPGRRTVPNAATFGRPAASGAGDTGFNSLNVPRSRAGAAAGPTAPQPASTAVRRTASPPPPAPLPLPVTATPQARRAAQREAQRLAADRTATGTVGVQSPNFFPPPPIRRIPADETPFDPLGWRAGAFLIKPAVELSGGYDSNPARAAGTVRGGAVYVIAPELTVRSDWRRHALNADLRGSYTGYGSNAAADRPNLDAKVDGRIDIRRDSSIDLQGRVLIATENPGSPNIQADLTRAPASLTTGFTGGLTQRFNRLELSAKGTIDRTTYEKSSFTDGTIESNEDRNLNQYGGILRGSYETLPGMKPFVEVAADTRVHDQQFDRSGQRRDSNGLTYRAGASFDLPRRLTGEISLGYMTRDYRDPALSSIGGLVLDSTLAWQATALTTATLTARSTVNELTQPGQSGYLSRDVGLTIDHAFRRYLIATLKGGIGFDTYDGAGRNDQRYLLSAGFIYKATREIHFKGEVRREWLTSSLPGQDYSADIFTLGVRLQR